MANETEVIRQQIEETRTSLQDKLETLEQQVKETVQEATEGVQNVKEAVKETVDSVKQSLDLNQHFQQQPWLFLAGAAAVGFVGGRLLVSAPALPQAAAPFSSPPVEPQAVPRNGAKTAAPAAKPTLLERFAAYYGDELAKLQGLAVGTLAAVVKEMITTAVAPAVAEQVTDILDSVTVKLGGKPIDGPLFASPAATDDKGDPAEYRQESQTGKAPGTPSSDGSAGFEGTVNRVFNTDRGT